MGEVHCQRPVLRLSAVFSSQPAAIDWARERLAAAWGPIALTSEPFPFVDTNYYEPSMGGGIVKQFFAHAELAAPDGLADWKVVANAWECERAAGEPTEVERPVNIDPGYIGLGKLVLASTKDHAHRIYLRDGIFAEVTLVWQRKQWRPRDWTFPDYRRSEYHAFFTRCREYLAAAYRASEETKLP